MRRTPQQPYTANNAVDKHRCCLRRKRSACSATSTWSTTGLLLLLLSCFSPPAEAAGLWGLGGGGAAKRGVGGQSVDSSDGDMDEVFAKLQREQVQQQHAPLVSRPLIFESSEGRASSAGVDLLTVDST